MSRVTATREEPIVSTWRELVDRHARVNCALEHALGQQHGLGVSEFEVLDRLASTEDGSGRITELADSVGLSQSALSRVVARLEADGLVKRSMCEHDRRGIYACLTDAGRDRQAEAQPTHRAILRENLA
jgi:DNA-binding MarR family transcriptional regulator